ncbi:hypothetical protein ACQ4PT_010177 [Festuca glaucescens]
MVDLSDTEVDNGYSEDEESIFEGDSSLYLNVPAEDGLIDGKDGDDDSMEIEGVGEDGVDDDDEEDEGDDDDDVEDGDDDNMEIEVEKEENDDDEVLNSDFFSEDLTDMDYAPDTCEDMTFGGLAVRCGERCRVHNLDPNKCVAFEGTNTRRRFYMCSVPNQVMNCGFVGWVDEEWPETMQNALRRLWAMYHESHSHIVDERLENARLMQVLVDKKNMVKKNYNSLMADVNKMIQDT